MRFDRLRSRGPDAVRWAAVTGAALLAYLFARHALSTVYKTYDDEGYMLLSLDHYLRGGHLYTEVFTQYGPFFFYAQAAVFGLLRLPVTHDSGRLVTLLFWMASAGLGGWFVHRVTRNTVLAAAAGLAVAVLMHDLSFEPGHPQQEILLGLMLACVVSTFGGRGAMALLGAIGAALVFTKINVGAFYLAALGFTLVCRLPEGWGRRILVGLSLVYALGFPVALMWRHLPGASGFCVLAAAAAGGTFLAASLEAPRGAHPLRDLYYAAAGAAAGALLIAGEAMREGMSLATLMEGVVWTPMRHPGVFSMVVGVGAGIAALAVIVTGSLVGLHLSADGRRDRAAGRVQHESGVPLERLRDLQCGIGLIAIPLLVAAAFNSAWILPFLPLGLLRLRDAGCTEATPRLFVACLSATQFLQLYPVAGTQAAVAASPLLLWAFVCIHDGTDGRVFLARLRRSTVLGGLVLAGCAGTILGTGTCAQTYPTPASKLRGASWLHLPAGSEAGYRYLAGEIRANCDMLFTMPGMGSFNFWSGVPTPNGMNLTVWVREFTPAQQQSILDALRADPRACAVYSDETTKRWANTPEDLASPLARYVREEMPKVAGRMGYEIRVHPRRGERWVDATAGPSTAMGGSK
ncbi:MAG: hypothetical protein JST11_11390 [Acidobacteria bacterium]|nr:hypothetical protein [Acidobacteriota bacterium]